MGIEAEGGAAGAEVVVEAGELHRRAKAWERQAATYQAEIESARGELEKLRAEREQLAVKVSTLEPLAAELDVIKKSADEYRGRFEALTLDVEKDRGLRAVGVAVDDPRAEALVKHWRREMAEAAQEARVGFDAWLGAARESDPIVAALVAVKGVQAAPAGVSTATGTAAEPVRRSPDVAALGAEHQRLVKAGKLAEARAILDQINGLRR